jgi:hypothetical protein
VDGEVARFRREASLTGKFLDGTGHIVTISLMCLGFATGHFLRSGDWEIFIFAALYSIFCIRIDLLVRADVVSLFLLEQPDKQYDYYTKIRLHQSAKIAENLNRETGKVKSRLLQSMKGFFAFPTSLNVLTLCWFSDFLFHTSLIYWVLIIYGTLTPLRN